MWAGNHYWCKYCTPGRTPSCWPEESFPRWGQHQSPPGGLTRWQDWMGLGTAESVEVMMQGRRTDSHHVISQCLINKWSFFSPSVLLLPSSCMYPCQRCSSCGGSGEQLYRENWYLTPGRKLADCKKGNGVYYTEYFQWYERWGWGVLKLKIWFTYI